MPPVPPTANPSETVERIREILVGRQLDHLQARLLRLEATQHIPPSDSEVHGRLSTHEARLEAVQQQLFKLQKQQQQTQVALEQRTEFLRLESQRIAKLIQQAAVDRSNQHDPNLETAEQRFLDWFTQWQKSLHDHLEQREAGMIRHVQELLNRHFSNVHASVDQQLSETQRDARSLDAQFRQIADAARALADSVGGSLLEPTLETRRAL